MADTIVTFTSRPVEEILQTGGSQAWKLRPTNARVMTYLVCARNQTSECQGSEAHRAGFLIGRITGVVSAPEDPRKRYLIRIGEWAPISVPNLWDFGRNPIHYANLAELGIDPKKIEFRPMPEPQGGIRGDMAPPAPRGEKADRDQGDSLKSLTIAEAKRALAATFGVDVEAIEITIRG